MNHFSQMEKQVLKILGRRKLTIAELVDRYLDEHETIHSVDPQNYFATIVRRITKKCEYHKLSFTIEGKGGGRHGRTVWRTPQKIH